MDVFNVKKKVGKYKDSLRDKNPTQTGLRKKGSLFTQLRRQKKFRNNFGLGHGLIQRLKLC